MATLVLWAIAACGVGRPAATTAEDSTYVGVDSATRVPTDTETPSAVVGAASPPSTTTVAAAPQKPVVALSPLADSIAQYLVFDPIVQTWFLAAKRGKRLLLDIGRVDTDVQHDKRRAAAYVLAVKALSPVPMGTVLRLHDAWGVEDDTIAGFTSWNGRIVATLHVSRHLDSLVRRAPAAYAAAERVDTTQTAVDSAVRDTIRVPDTAHRRPAVPPPSAAPPPAPDGRRGAGPPASVTSTTARPDSAVRIDSSSTALDSCQRDSLPLALTLRAAAVRDSIDFWLRTQPPPPYDRLLSTERSHATQVIGCFTGANRLALAVDLRAGANEWIRERAVLIDTLGRVTSLRISDFRFKGHDFMAAFDANGHGVDGIAARGVTQDAGGTVILILDSPNRLTRWVDGFSWESR